MTVLSIKWIDLCFFYDTMWNIEYFIDEVDKCSKFYDVKKYALFIFSKSFDTKIEYNFLLTKQRIWQLFNIFILVL